MTSHNMSVNTKPKNTIVCTIHNAKDLVALNRDHSSNPLVCVSVNDNQSAATTVQRQTCNPHYNCTFAFEDCPLPSTLTIQVLNKVDYMDVEEVMGMAQITLHETCNAPMMHISLHHGNNAKLARWATNGCGSVFISYSVTPHCMMDQDRYSTPNVYEQKNVSFKKTVMGVTSPLPSTAPLFPSALPEVNNIVHCAATPVHALPWPAIQALEQNINFNDENHNTNVHTGSNCVNDVKVIAQEPFAALHELVAKSPQLQRSFAPPPKSVSLEASFAFLSETASNHSSNASSRAPSASSSFADFCDMQKKSLYSEMLICTETSPPSLIPPRLAPVKVPVNLSYLVAESAPAAPTVHTFSLNMKQKAKKVDFSKKHMQQQQQQHSIPCCALDVNEEEEEELSVGIKAEEYVHSPMFVSYAVPMSRNACAICGNNNNYNNGTHLLLHDLQWNSNENTNYDVDCKEEEEEEFYAINDVANKVSVGLSPASHPSIQFSVESTLPIAEKTHTADFDTTTINSNVDKLDNKSNMKGKRQCEQRCQLLHALADPYLVHDASLVARSARNSPRGKVTPASMNVDASHAPNVVLHGSFQLPQSSKLTKILSSSSSEPSSSEFQETTPCSLQLLSSLPSSCPLMLRESVEYEMQMPVIKAPHPLPLSLSTCSSRRNTPHANVLLSQTQILSQFPAFPLSNEHSNSPTSNVFGHADAAIVNPTNNTDATEAATATCENCTYTFKMN